MAGPAGAHRSRRIVELSAAPSGLTRAAALSVARRRRPVELPAKTLVLRGVGTDVERLAGYTRVCGYRLENTLPPTWPHVLAFPLAMKLMADKDFPFPVVGLVHVANRIELVRPIDLGERLDIAVYAQSLRPHERGRQFDLLATASVDGVVVWRGVSTYLRREQSTASRETRSAGPGEAQTATTAPAPAARWRVERAVGRDYAGVSGDHNPIHTSRLGARAFGFTRPIAHGMWSKARCLAALSGRLPAAYTVEVSFKLPILLPATVAFAATPQHPGWDFALHDARSGRPHLAGSLH